jgi:hypothetical protein
MEQNKTQEFDTSNKKTKMDEQTNPKKSSGFVLIVIGTVFLIVNVLLFGLSMISHNHRDIALNKPSFNNNREKIRQGNSMMNQRNHSGIRQGQHNYEVIKIEGNNITVKNSNGTEYPVIISNTTSFSKAGEIAKLADLKVGDKIVIFGSSDSAGQIVASSIKIQ